MLSTLATKAPPYDAFACVRVKVAGAGVDRETLAVCHVIYTPYNKDDCVVRQSSEKDGAKVYTLTLAAFLVAVQVPSR